MSKADNKNFLGLWLINPFLGAVFLFRNFKDNTSIFPYLLLSVFFGLSFVVSTTGADSMRYAESLRNQHEQNSSLSTVLQDFYGEEDGSLDVYQPIITWLVSVFTDNVKILFAVFALVFGYFWFKSLLLIRSYITVPFTGLILVTFLFLALTNPIWTINGVRMWTAVGIFFYGLLLLQLEDNKKGWFLLILPLFVHFSLVVALFLYIIYFLLPVKNKNILFGIFIITFFFGELNLEVLRGYFDQLPGFAQSKKSYLQEGYAEGLLEAQNQLSVHVVLARTLAKYSTVFMASVVYYFVTYKKEKLSKELELFFKMGLFFASFSNLAASVPSGGRFLVLSNLILLTAFLFSLNQQISIPIILRKLLTLSISLIIIFKIREGLDFIGITFFMGNPILNFFIADTPLIDFIKSIF